MFAVTPEKMHRLRTRPLFCSLSVQVKLKQASKTGQASSTPLPQVQRASRAAGFVAERSMTSFVL
jgi:hypothetical protein